MISIEEQSNTVVNESKTTQGAMAKVTARTGSCSTGKTRQTSKLREAILDRLGNDLPDDLMRIVRRRRREYRCAFSGEFRDEAGIGPYLPRKKHDEFMKKFRVELLPWHVPDSRALARVLPVLDYIGIGNVFRMPLLDFRDKYKRYVKEFIVEMLRQSGGLEFTADTEDRAKYITANKSLLGRVFGVRAWGNAKHIRGVIKEFDHLFSDCDFQQDQWVPASKCVDKDMRTILVSLTSLLRPGSKNRICYVAIRLLLDGLRGEKINWSKHLFGVQNRMIGNLKKAIKKFENAEIEVINTRLAFFHGPIAAYLGRQTLKDFTDYVGDRLAALRSLSTSAPLTNPQDILTLLAPGARLVTVSTSHTPERATLTKRRHKRNRVAVSETESSSDGENFPSAVNRSAGQGSSYVYISESDESTEKDDSGESIEANEEVNKDKDVHYKQKREPNERTRGRGRGRGRGLRRGLGRGLGRGLRRGRGRRRGSGRGRGRGHTHENGRKEKPLGEGSEQGIENSLFRSGPEMKTSLYDEPNTNRVKENELTGEHEILEVHVPVAEFTQSATEARTIPGQHVVNIPKPIGCSYVVADQDVENFVSLAINNTGSTERRHNPAVVADQGVENLASLAPNDKDFTERRQKPAVVADQNVENLVSLAPNDKDFTERRHNPAALDCEVKGEFTDACRSCETVANGDGEQKHNRMVGETELRFAAGLQNLSTSKETFANIVGAGTSTLGAQIDVLGKNTEAVALIVNNFRNAAELTRLQTKKCEVEFEPRRRKLLTLREQDKRRIAERTQLSEQLAGIYSEIHNADAEYDSRNLRKNNFDEFVDLFGSVQQAENAIAVHKLENEQRLRTLAKLKGKTEQLTNLKLLVKDSSRFTKQAQGMTEERPSELTALRPD